MNEIDLPSLGQVSDCSSLDRTTLSILQLFRRVPGQVCAEFFEPSRVIELLNARDAEVPVPTDFGLPYENLELVTPDNVKLRSYLLVQRRELSHPGAGRLDIQEDETDEEVCSCSSIHYLEV